MASDQNNKIVGSGNRAEAAAVHEYWTPERRAAAKPVPPPKPPKKEETPKEPEAGPAPGRVPSSRPTGEGEAARSQMLIGGQPVPSPTLYPYRTCGKLFFSQGGSDFAGSASVVARNIILTAGHCVHSGPGGSCGPQTLRSIPPIPTCRGFISPTTMKLPGRLGLGTVPGGTTTG